MGADECGSLSEHLPSLVIPSCGGFCQEQSYLPVNNGIYHLYSGTNVFREGRPSAHVLMHKKYHSRRWFTVGALLEKGVIIYTRTFLRHTVLVLSTRTSNGVRPKHQQCLLLFPFPSFLPARHSLFFYFYCLILRCASGYPSRCPRRHTTKNMLQLPRACRDDRGCSGCHRAR